jgi:bifunctional non-homologous end joining protein LigD
VEAERRSARWTEEGPPAFELQGERLKGGWSLIRMRGDGKRGNWLLIKENDEEVRHDANGEFLDDRASGVKSGRSMNDIAGGKKPARAKKAAAGTEQSVKRLMAQYPEVRSRR